jgi:hypothetical protein
LENLIYDEDAAVLVTYQNLSPSTRLSIEEDDVRIILKLFYQYKCEHGFIIADEDEEKYSKFKDVLEEPSFDAKSVCPWVLERIDELGLPYTLDLLYEVFDAETCYLISASICDGEFPLDNFIDTKKATKSIKIEHN